MCRAKSETGRRCPSSAPERRREQQVEILVAEGFSEAEALEWMTYPGVEYRLSAAREWRGYALRDYVAWANVVSSRTDADSWRAAGWEPGQYRELLRLVMGTSAGDTVFEQWDAESAVLDGWRTSGVPGSRAVLYLRAGFTLPGALEVERTHSDPDGALRTLAALDGI